MKCLCHRRGTATREPQADAGRHGEWSGPTVDRARRPAKDRVKVMRDCVRQRGTDGAIESARLCASRQRLGIFLIATVSRLWNRGWDFDCRQDVLVGLPLPVYEAGYSMMSP
jgi:hypothetical protein